MVDAAALKASFAAVAGHGDEVPLFFYSYLFLRHPEVRTMFPPSMAAQRDRLVGALGQIVSAVDRVEQLVPFVEQLGRDHRKFAVRPEHYPAVGEALLATLSHFLGEQWTPALSRDWTAAYELLSSVMIDAAAAAEAPPWWDAEVTGHELRTPDLAVITVRPASAVDYRPGQSLSVETPQRPRLWRYYSPANAPRPDRSLEFHVRAVDGGWVSSALVHRVGVGDVVRLGPAVGTDLVLDPDSDRDLLLLAGGTGLAPLRAIVEQLARERDGSRRVHLFVEGRTEREHYDLPVLERLAEANPWLSVVPVVGGGSWFEPAPVLAGRRVRQESAERRRLPVQRGSAAEVALSMRTWGEHDVYLCGSEAMVGQARARLAEAGLPAARIHQETFSYRRSSELPAAGAAAEPVDAAAPAAARTGGAR